MKNASRGLLALVAAVSIGALPSAAHAERVVHKDASGDVIASTYDGETATSTDVVEPDVKPGDILHTVVRHTTGKVIVRVFFADLRRADQTQGHFVRLVTNEGVRRNLFLEATKEHPRGTLYFSKPNGPADCKGLSYDVDYVAEKLSFEVPRSCLSGPRWVRVGVQTMRYPTASTDTNHIDDANKDAAYGAQPTLGVRVHRN